jgi:hypothetical protein
LEHVGGVKWCGLVSRHRASVNVAAAGLVDVEFVPDVLVRGVWLGTRRGDE